MRRALAALIFLPIVAGAQEPSQTHLNNTTLAHADREFASASSEGGTTGHAERIIHIPYVPLGFAPEDYLVSQGSPPIYDFDLFFKDYFGIGAEGSSAIYTPETGEIIIRNTGKNTDLIQFYFESCFPITNAKSKALGWLKTTRGKSADELAALLKASRQTFDPILKGYILELEKVEDLRKRVVRRGDPDPVELAILDRRIASLNEALAGEFAPLRTRLQTQLGTLTETEKYLQANRIVGNRPTKEPLLGQFRPAKPTALTKAFTGTLPLTGSVPAKPLQFNFIHPASVGPGHFPQESPFLTRSQDGGKSFNGNPYQLRKVLPSLERIKSLESYEALIDLLGKPTTPAIFAHRDDSLDIEKEYWLLFQPVTDSSIRVLQVGVARKIHQPENGRETLLETTFVREAMLTNRSQE